MDEGPCVTLRIVDMACHFQRRHRGRGQEVAAARCGRQVGEQEGHPSCPRHREDRHGVALSHGEW